MKISCQLAVAIAFAAAATSSPAPAATICAGNWVKLSPTPAPTTRYAAASAFDSTREVIVLFGGHGTTTLGDTWEWDGTNWSQKTPANAPGAVFLHAMAYDSTRHVTVLFGGVNNNSSPSVFSNDTLEWTGTTWNRRVLMTSPPPRAGHAMAFDSAHGVTLLYGGIFTDGTNTSALGDTWKWDGTAWTQLFPAVNPPLLAAPAMAYDSVRQRIVMFGGTSTGGTFSNQTWEWDGANWSQQTPATSPSERDLVGMAYDSKRRMTVLFGGFDGTTNSNETWEWDGSDWFLRGSFDAPSARQGPAMAYDIAHDAVVLFGGEDNATNTSAETWRWTGPGVFITQQPADQSVAVGQSASFTVAADSNADLTGGPLPLSYAWRQDGAPLSDSSSISGSHTATITINPAKSINVGKYDCLVGNGCGAVTSAVVTLDTCKPANASDDCDANGIADACDIAANPTLDADSNGKLDSCETATPSAQTAPCGTCGGGAATMLPMALLGMGAARRKKRRA